MCGINTACIFDSNPMKTEVYQPWINIIYSPTTLYIMESACQSKPYDDIDMIDLENELLARKARNPKPGKCMQTLS